ncbi:unnamed protein product, partial [Mesorhabditis spiculigera]
MKDKEIDFGKKTDTPPFDAPEYRNQSLEATSRHCLIHHLVLDVDWHISGSRYHNYVIQLGPSNVSSITQGCLVHRPIEVIECRLIREAPFDPTYFGVKPQVAFACESLVVPVEQTTLHRRALGEILAALQPINLWLSECPGWNIYVGVPGSIFVNSVSRSQMQFMKHWPTPRIAFKITNWLDNDDGMDLCQNYLTDWRAGRRQIATFWCQLGGEDFQSHVHDIAAFAEKLNLKRDGIMYRWYGEAKRIDGRVMRIFARVLVDTLPYRGHKAHGHIIFNALGAPTTSFLRKAADHVYEFDAMAPNF